ncbi:MFS transporter [Paenibacillus lautus]|uniref:MFS transporter n=1 Tax=Paenibacillus lautus TaxID=1401 RepID=A0A385TI48_PAELA|nr:MFS transporter [Paenibacillus lautus]AYB43336.1 MFS transporter [Paenibacillus lautus]MCI1777594.1 MFS transporter [Paenibacillus lautus]VTR38503.1 Bacillibactin exporter [Actinobacillus pleuropneumoniae]
MKIQAHRLFYIITFIQFFMMEITGTTLILFIMNKGFSLQYANNLLIVLFISILLLEIPTGIIADRFGRKLSIVLGFICYLIYAVVFMLTDEFLLLIFAQIFGALATCLQSGALESWVVDHSDESIENIFATSSSVMYIAGFFCGLLGAVLASIYFVLPWMISIICCLSLIVLSIIYIKENHHSKFIKRGEVVEEKSVKKIIGSSINIILSNKQLWVIFIVGICISFSNSAPNSFQQPRFVGLSEHGLWIFGIIKTVYSLFMSLGGYLIKKLSKYYDDTTILIFSLLMLGVWLTIAGWFNDFYPVLVSFLIYEIGRGMYPAARKIYINKRIASDYRATILSLDSAITQIGMCIGLLVTGIISKNYTDLTSSQFPIQVSWMICGIAALLPIALLIKKEPQRQ